jgi:hypothetical protein
LGCRQPALTAVAPAPQLLLACPTPRARAVAEQPARAPADNSVNHQSNTAMAMLSIVNTVFLPLTFLAGEGRGGGGAR